MKMKNSILFVTIIFGGTFSNPSFQIYSGLGAGITINKG
jgi:hypothetical protein